MRREDADDQGKSERAGLQSVRGMMNRQHLPEWMNCTPGKSSALSLSLALWSLCHW